MVLRKRRRRRRTVGSRRGRDAIVNAVVPGKDVAEPVAGSGVEAVLRRVKREKGARANLREVEKRGRGEIPSLAL